MRQHTKPEKTFRYPSRSLNHRLRTPLGATDTLPDGGNLSEKQFLASLVGVTALSMLVAGVFAPRVAADDDDFFLFIPDTPVLSRSVYAGNASMVTVGQTLPPGCVAGSVPVPLLAGGSASVKVACGTAVAAEPTRLSSTTTARTEASASHRRFSSMTSPRMVT